MRKNSINCVSMGLCVLFCCSKVPMKGFNGNSDVTSQESQENDSAQKEVSRRATPKGPTNPEPVGSGEPTKEGQGVLSPRCRDEVYRDILKTLTPLSRGCTQDSDCISFSEIRYSCPYFRDSVGGGNHNVGFPVLSQHEEEKTAINGKIQTFEAEMKAAKVCALDGGCMAAQEYDPTSQKIVLSCSKAICIWAVSPK